MKHKTLFLAALFSLFTPERIYSQAMEMDRSSSDSTVVNAQLNVPNIADPRMKLTDEKSRIRLSDFDIEYGIEGSYLDFVDTRSKGFNLGVHTSIFVGNSRYWRMNLLDFSVTAGAIFGEQRLFNPKIALQFVQVFNPHVGLNLGAYLEHYGNYKLDLVGFRFGPIVGLNWDGLININYQYGLPLGGERLDQLGQHQLTIGLKLNFNTFLCFFSMYDV